MKMFVIFLVLFAGLGRSRPQNDRFEPVCLGDAMILSANTSLGRCMTRRQTVNLTDDAENIQ